ncbi:hypothetical protein [Faecalispora jeddahensis]|uniref:hypothetical protein n=1 Tax=Faecalispora jeddahensis TaxID=1414721 RepID=UPI00189AB840|nr:hypothetical protein [Faecalispora jeddahensis]
MENDNKKWTQRYLPDTAVSVQVVIDFSKRKETAALKIEAAVSLAHDIWLLYDGFFSFAVVRQIFEYLV